MSKEMITYKILILGDSTVGKTAFIVRFCEGRFEEDSLTTIGLDSKVKFISRQEKKIQLQIWDTAGQERFRSLSKNYYKGADGILLMYDISNYESFKHIKNWITDIKNNIGNKKHKPLCLLRYYKVQQHSDQCKFKTCKGYKRHSALTLF